MNTHLYGILDCDSTYSRLFANYLNNLSRLSNNFIVFTDTDSLLNFQYKSDLQILFLGQSFDLNIIIDHISAERIVILADDDCIADENSFPKINKYNSPEIIFSKAINLLNQNNSMCSTDDKKDSSLINLIKEDINYRYSEVKFIGVYSPYSLELQTICALCMGLHLSNFNSVLFLDLLRFSPIISDNNQGGFSDLIYYYRSNKESLYDKLHTLTSSYHNFDYIKPPKTGEDISSFPTEIFDSCLHFLADTFNYDYIIVNLGNHLYPLCNYISCFQLTLSPYYLYSQPIDDLYNYLHFSDLSEIIPSVKGLEIEDTIKAVNFSSYKNLSALMSEIKSHPLFHRISSFTDEQIKKEV